MSNKKKANEGLLPLGANPKIRTAEKTTALMMNIFIVFFVLNLFICFVMALLSHGSSISATLFGSGRYTDVFMDFMNSIRDCGSVDVYSARNNIYPPLCVLFFRILSKLVAPELISTKFAERKTLLDDQRCMMIYVLFVVVCLLCITLMMYSRFSDSKSTHRGKVISFLLIVAYPLIYCIERGNVLLLSVVFLMFFVFFRNSENKIIRELSYISLAFAAGIKYYPAVFGLLVLADKKYKDTARIILYGLLVMIVPYIFLDATNPGSSGVAVTENMTVSLTGGSLTASTADKFAAVADNIFKSLAKFVLGKISYLNFSSICISNFLYYIGNGPASVAAVLIVLTEIVALVCVFLLRKPWQKVLMVTYLMLNFPAASSSYALTYMFIPLVCFLCDTEKREKIDWLFLVGFMLLLTPLPMPWYGHENKFVVFTSILHDWPYELSLNKIIACPVFQIMGFALMIKTIIRLFMEKPVKSSVVAGQGIAKKEDGTEDESGVPQGEALFSETGSQPEADSESETPFSEKMPE